MGSWAAFAFVVMGFCAGGVEAYENHTVGGTAGWFFTNNASVVDYSKWAGTQRFSLGDYLIFHTNANHSVIQTYNETTYKKCDYDNAEDDDTDVWLAVDPTKKGNRLTVSVPLTIEGPNYFFSNALDRIECMNGLKFQIKVAHGQGLPAALTHPPPPPFTEQNSASPPPVDNSLTNSPLVMLSPPPSGSMPISSLNNCAFMLFFPLAILVF
eukprot:Gb_10362 [translate_table: standard]